MTTSNLAQQIDAGFVFIKLRGKQPIQKDWQNRTVSIKAGELGDADNVGLILGDASGGVVDVDIDDLNALRLAEYFLPQTYCQFGRASKPNSHRLYRVPRAGKTRQFQHPDFGMIVELRGNGSQTMVPPSTHPDGEPVEYTWCELPSQQEWARLERSVTELAIATLVAPYWKPGNRHNLCLTLTGVLRRSGWSEEQVGDFVSRLVDAFKDEEQTDRFRCVESTFELGQAVNGQSRLAEVVGEDDAKCICNWLGGRPEPKEKKGSNVVLKNFTDDDCAEEFAKFYRGKLICSLAENAWLKRQNGVFSRVSEAEVQNLVADCGHELEQSYNFRDLQKYFSASGSKAILSLAKGKLGVHLDKLDNDPDLVGCKNGVVDLRTDELLHSTDAIVTRKLATYYDPDAKCPQFIKFLDEIFEDNQEIIQFLQRCLGYTLQGNVGGQCMFICIGSGRNGKSTLMGVLAKLFSDYAWALPMSSLVDKKFGNDQTNDLAMLRGKRFVACHEGEAGNKLAEAKVKMITGGDPIVARKLYQDFCMFMPSHKIWLATNELPQVEGTNEAIWRRLENVIRFPVTIPEHKVDPHLGAKLEQELPGILNFILEGYRDYKEKGFKRPLCVIREAQEYRSTSDSVGLFIEACCQPEASAKSTTRDLHSAYSCWCFDNGQDELSKSAFGKALAQKNFESYKGRDGNGWLGLQLLPTSCQQSGCFS